MITITKSEFIDYTGIDLGIELKDYDEGSKKVERAISLWTKRVYREAKKASTRPLPEDSELNADQKRAIKDAICEYGKYFLKSGDLYTLSGYSEDRGQTISADEKQKIQFPVECLDILRDFGLIRRSQSRKRIYSQTHDYYPY